jgi:hypothetical protein
MNNMQEIFLVDAFLNSEKSKVVFLEAMKRVREAGFKICLVTNLRPTLDVLDAVDYCFFDESNKKFKTEFDEYPIINIFAQNGEIGLRSESLHKQKHSLSVHINLYRGLEILKSLGYTHCYRMEYDGLIANEDMDKVKELPSRLGDKKALFYIDKNNKHIFYHLWYCEVDWMLENFTKIRDEQDYVDRVIQLAGSKKFIPAEEFLSLDLKEKYDEAIILDTVDGSYNSEYPNTRWNNIISDHTNEKFKKGFYGGVFRVAKDTPGGLHVKGDKGAVVAWNLNSTEDNWVEVVFYDKEGKTDGQIKLDLAKNEGWKVQFFEFSEDCEVEVKMSNGDSHTFLMCKNFLTKTRDTVIIHEDSTN